MPLAVGTGTPTTPPSVTPLPDVGTIRAVWHAPDGTSWDLTPPLGADTWWLTGPGIAGWGAPPVALAQDPHPRGGARVRHRRTLARTVTWPVHVWGDTHLTFLARRRALTDAFAQTTELGPGVLEVARPDGSRRQITGWYVDGAEGTAGEDWLHANLIVQLLCEDPWWRDVDPTTDFAEHVAPTTPFLDPFMTIASSQVLGETTIVNTGEVEAWPTWTITGPATEVTATNLTYNESWTLTPDFGDGDSLGDNQAIITTDPPTVRGPGGEVWTGRLDWPGATLWSLRPGINEIEFTVSGADVGTRIEWAYYRRWRTA